MLKFRSAGFLRRTRAHGLALAALGVALCAGGAARAQQEPPPATTPPPTADREAIDAKPLATPWSSARLQVSYTPPSGYQETAPGRSADVAFQGALSGAIRATIKMRILQTHGMALSTLAAEIAQVLTQAQPDVRVLARAASREGGDDCYRIELGGTETIPQSGTHPIQLRLLFITHAQQTCFFILAADPGVFAAEATAFEQSMGSIRWSAPIPAENVNMTNIGVLLTVPENWRLVKQGDPDAIPGVPFVIFGPTVDTYRSNITMVLVTVPPGVTELSADAARQEAISQAQIRENFHYLSQTRVAIDGVPALVLDGAFQYPQTHTAGMDRIVLLIRGGQMYTFHFSASRTGFNAEAQAAFAAFMNSIRWVKPGDNGAAR